MSDNVDNVDNKVSKEKVEITIDNEVETVLELDATGEDLVFSVEPDKFIELELEEINKLSKKNKAAYAIAKLLYDKTERQVKTPPTENLSIRPKFATATKRLEVRTSKQFDKKFHKCWKRPDETAAALREGYTYVTNQDVGVDSFTSDKNGRHYVGDKGNFELVLMKIPKEDAEAKIAHAGKLSDIQNGAVEDSAVAQMERDGGQGNAFDFSKKGEKKN